MKTSVYETGDMVRVLEISADASDLETDIRLALKKFRSSLRLPGFRQGHVPVNLIRRRYAKDIEQYVVENLLKEVWDDFIGTNQQYKLLGRSKIIDHSYKLDEDLLIRIEFYVAPLIQLKDLSGHILRVPRFLVSDTLVDFFIKKRLTSHIKPRPLTSLERIGDSRHGLFDQVKYHQSEVDQVSDHMMIGQHKVQVEFFDFGSYSSHDQTKNEKLRDSLRGRSVGEFLQMDKEGAQEYIHVPDSALMKYQIKIMEAFRYDWPEIDDHWASVVSDHMVDSADVLHSWVRDFLLKQFHRLTLKVLEHVLQERMFELHPFSLPSNYPEAFFNITEEDISEITKDPYMSSRLQWVFLIGAIEEQLKELPIPEGHDSETMDMTLQHSDSDQEELLNKLLSQFQIEYIDLPEDSIDHFIHIEHLI